MRYLFRILTLSIIVSATIFFAACGGGDDDPKKSDKQLQIELLAGTWNSQSATHNAINVATDWNAFKLTIAQAGTAETMTYSTAGRPVEVLSPWDASGTISFGTPITEKFVLGDGATPTYSLSGNTLTITFSGYSGEGYAGRVSSAEGDWVFTLTK